MPAIFLRDNKNFFAMREQPYETEDVLQALIAEHPEILAGDESGERSQWLLIKPEAGIAGQENGSDRWSLDHLFLDSAGVPTLVEVKRSSDTRNRREVVAQMLDYAANASAFWSVETLQAWYEAQCESLELDPDERLRSLFAIEDVEAYWAAVKTNLAAERIRLVFVADEIPSELRRIIEFLNRQMADTEVFAIEVKQYVDAAGQRQTIVPRVIGQTEAAKAAKTGGTRARRQWDETSFLAETRLQNGPEIEQVARLLLEGAKAIDGAQVTYGTGATDGSAQIRIHEGGAKILSPFNVWTSGSVNIPFDYIRDGNQLPFTERESRDELRERIRAAAPTADIPAEDVRFCPDVRLEALADPDAREAFLAAVSWAADQVRQAQRVAPAELRAE